MVEPLVHQSIGIAAPHRGFQPDTGAELVRIVERQVGREMTAHRAAHVHGPLEFKLVTKLHPVTHEPILGELVFLFPVPDRSRGKRFAVIGKVGGNHVKARGDIAILEEVPILASIRSRRMLAYQRYPLSRLLDVDAVLDSVQFKVNIAPGNVGKLCHCPDSLYAARDSITAWRMIALMRRIA